MAITKWSIPASETRSPALGGIVRPQTQNRMTMKKSSRLVRRKIRRKKKKNVLSLQLARDRARQSRGSSNQHVSLVVSNSESKEFGNQRLLEGLKAENALLRGSVVDLLLQLQALRDAAK
jgi:hypothetical protein